MNLLTSLRYLLALHEHRHFGRAAAACHITQPALSNALRALEDEFGVTIVQRGRTFAGFTPEGERVLAAMQALRSHQPLHDDTGATHAAGFADAQGRLLCVREDVGRHNALDKLIGTLARSAVDRSQGFALVTSRASHEMAAKAARAGMPLLAAVSGVTRLAVQTACESGLCLVGFARGTNLSVYANAHRLKG